MTITHAGIGQTRAIDPEFLLEGRRIKPLQYLVFAFCAAVALMDGMDSQSIGVAGPLMAAELHMPMSQFTPALSAGLLGAAIGAMLFGSVADRFGRRPVLMAATALFGTFTLLTAVSTSFASLIAIRFIAGLGLGGATPCFITMAAEFSPGRHRGAITSLLWAGFPLGNAVGGFTSGFLVRQSSWQTVFLVAGTPTIILAILMAVLLPESLRYLVAHGADPTRIQQLARRLDPSCERVVIGAGSGKAGDVQGPTTASRPDFFASLKALFSQGRLVGTLLIWLVLYLGFATTTVMTLMSPTLLRAAGISLSLSGMLVGLYSIMSMTGMAIAGRVVQKIGPMLTLTPAFLIGAVFLAGMGTLREPVFLAIFMSVIGFTVPLAVAGGIALAAIFYPTAIRSSGVGWGMGLGRFGQVCSPLAIGLMLSLAWAPERISLVLAGAPMLAGLAVACFASSLRSRPALVGMSGGQSGEARS